MARVKSNIFRSPSEIYRTIRQLFLPAEGNQDSALARAAERERRTMLSGFASVLARATWALTLIISVPITLGYLGPERYGLWMTITSLLTLLQFADFGIGNGLLNSVSEAYGKKDEASAQKKISSAFFSLLGLAAIVGALFFITYGSINWGAVFNVTDIRAVSEAGPATAVFALTFLVALPFSVVGRTQQGYQEGYIDSLWQVVGRFLGLVSIVIAINLRLGLPWLVLSFSGAPVLMQVFNFGVYFHRQRRPIRPALRTWDREAAEQVMRIGFLFFLLQLVIAIAFASDTLVLAQLLGPAAVATYTIAFQLFSFVPMLVRVFLLPLWPAYSEASARGDERWVATTLRSSLRLSLLIGLPVAGVLIIGGPAIINLWTGSAIEPPILLLIALAINAIILYGWGDPIAMYLNGTGKVGFEVSWAIPMAVVNLPLSIFLTSQIGVSGVAWGTSLSYLLLMVIPTSLYMRRNLTSRSSPVARSTHEAVLMLREDQTHKELIHDSYLGADLPVSLERFRSSSEFANVLALLGDLSKKTVLDIGTGNGIAAAAFALAGATRVIALDPDLSDQIGARAASKLAMGKPVYVAAAIGERLPLIEDTVDIVYSRQVLHHAQDLDAMVSACYRVLRPGGVFLATRDHVVDNEQQLRKFLSEHPVHKMAGGENAFGLEEYVAAFQSAGFVLERAFGPWDSVINAFPVAQNEQELHALPETLLKRKLGSIGSLIANLPGVSRLIMIFLDRYRKPGRMYSFLARKPL